MVRRLFNIKKSNKISKRNKRNKKKSNKIKRKFKFGTKKTLLDINNIVGGKISDYVVPNNMIIDTLEEGHGVILWDGQNDDRNDGKTIMIVKEKGIEPEQCNLSYFIDDYGHLPPCFDCFRKDYGHGYDSDYDEDISIVHNTIRWFYVSDILKNIKVKKLYKIIKPYTTLTIKLGVYGTRTFLLERPYDKVINDIQNIQLSVKLFPNLLKYYVMIEIGHENNNYIDLKRLYSVNKKTLDVQKFNIDTQNLTIVENIKIE